MTAWNALAAVTGNGYKLVRRDNLLRWMMLVPVVSILALRWGLPALAPAVRPWFDLEDYYVLIASYFLLGLTTYSYGQVAGLMLLDEREEGTLSAMRVTPLPYGTYLALRLTAPTLLTGAASVLAIKVVAIVDVPWVPVIVISGVMSMGVAMVALALAAMASNKVEALAIGKVGGAIMLLPVVAYFLDPGWQLAVGVLPTFWPIKAFWEAEAGRGYLTYLAVGVALHIAALYWCARRFARVASS